jgi:hypothetical protein
VIDWLIETIFAIVQRVQKLFGNISPGFLKNDCLRLFPGTCVMTKVTPCRKMTLFIGF